jgi:hypothetical protein
MYPRKIATKRQMLEILQNGKFEFAPLEIAAVPAPPERDKAMRTSMPDTLLAVKWGHAKHVFAVEIKTLWTPKAVETAVDQARRYAESNGALPLIFVPYLAQETLLQLEAQRVSAIDLCGNGIVIAPDALLVLRTGFPNQFRWSAAIKNIYRRNSSVVARVFLLTPQFDSVKAVLEAIRHRESQVTLPTVSKVCKSLEADLVIERSPGKAPAARTLCLLQADKLIDRLAQNYLPPEVTRTLKGKVRLPPDEVRKRLAQGAADRAVKIVMTGASSVEHYAVMAREPVQSFYCTDLDQVVASLGSDLQQTDRFANVIFQETLDESVYFDRRPALAASPIQTYLELVNGDQREQEAALQLRHMILRQAAVPPHREQ